MITQETLELLEWKRLCQHLATFADTKLGAIAASNLQLPTTKEGSLQLLAQTQEIYNLEQQLDSGWTFKGIKNINQALERASIGGLLSAKELLDVATTLAGVRYLRRTIDAKAEELPTLNQLILDLRTYPEIEQEIHHCIDDRGEITDRANPKLAGIRSKIKSLRSKIRQILQRIMQKNMGAVQEAVITQRSERFVLPVKAPQKESIPGIVHDVSSTGSTLYIEPRSVIEFGNQLRQAEKQEKREEEAILRALTAKIAEVLEDIEKLLAVATILDLATARARYGAWLEANPPRFTDPEETVTLRRLQHPLLVWQAKYEEGNAVVPIDVKIEPQTIVVAITGPNTGGKTVTLKTIGLAALMAKAGMFVPAKVPVEIPWFDSVLADIGDEQSLQQSLSTFSGHIRRISRIIEAIKPQSIAENVANNSLVLLDEVGAGTDPAEGSALAIAILKYLAEHTLLTVATTHYGELKALKYQDERFENASVEFDDSTLQPTYRLLWGIPGRSNALTIAQRLGLDTAIVEDAQSLVGATKTQDVNEVIAALEAQRREQEAKAAEAAKLLAETEKFYSEVSQKADSLKEREQQLKVSQEEAVKKALLDAKSQIAQVIHNLQRGEQSAQKAQKATEALDKIAGRHLKTTQQPQPAKPDYKPQLGEKIRIPRLGQTGEVLEIDEAEKQLIVRFGFMKMSVGWGEIESLDGQKVPAPAKNQAKQTRKTPPAARKQPSVTVRTSQNTLDIRGSRVANAEIEVDNAIAKAIESGVLWIIHGKGTGKLREGVHEFLQRHSQVAKYELAPQKEGGAGVTLVYLK
ncbi:Endonuclease MutS2 [Hyella patelloides LEGE 07179]|uniref:Endonuclease MutS2 n=1 Tax=Hyella patelloides LEGE 07179 TaxID=945734 RepID=A0A563VT91_9CYAN|nr:endonuclease MutS2 [Hyella patelloides]VEP14633.1 Endonuclease MutS2 [Hyella patelloides LEGE 07179]